jgi:hypothetical protein
MYATRRDLQTVLRLFKGIVEGDFGRHQAMRIIDRVDQALGTNDLISAEEHDGFFVLTVEHGDGVDQQQLDLETSTLADVLEEIVKETEPNAP